MPLVVFHTRRVRDALAAPAKVGIDVLVLMGVAGVIGALVMVGRQFSQPYTEAGVVIDLSWWSLPKYTLFSLSRGFAAYVLSLLFTLVYGTVAAHNHRAERVMLPALDVLQALPVLTFLPGIVIAMVSLFPAREIGLEIAAIVTIFTAQVWNMTFSFHGSLRSIPPTMREVAAIQRLSGWQVFRLLEVPAAMIGLVWNSMMSMAGGWFFLTVNEAFTLAGKDYRLPGIGSYMNEAVNQHNLPAQLAAIVAMIVMIVAVDQLFWRPVVVWAQRFKMEELSGDDKPQSWVLHLLQSSRVYHWLGKALARHRKPPAAVPVVPEAEAKPAPVVAAEARPSRAPAIKSAMNWAVVILLAVGAAFGLWQLLKLLLEVPLRAPTTGQDWGHVLLALGASFLRTSAAVLLGAAWTLPAGILIGLSPKWSSRLQPIIQVVASFPAPMLFLFVYVALQFLHIPFTVGCIALMLLGTQWYILFNVIAGASAIPADLKEVGEVYRMSRTQKWRRLYLPSVFPYLVTGLVTAAGGAWNATIVAEYFQASKDAEPITTFGLGSMISQATADGHYALLAAAATTMALFVVLVNRFFWKRMYRLAEERYSLNA